MWHVVMVAVTTWRQAPTAAQPIRSTVQSVAPKSTLDNKTSHFSYPASARCAIAPRSNYIWHGAPLHITSATLWPTFSTVSLRLFLSPNITLSLQQRIAFGAIFHLKLCRSSDFFLLSAHAQRRRTCPETVDPIFRLLLTTASFCPYLGDWFSLHQFWAFVKATFCYHNVTY